MLVYDGRSVTVRGTRRTSPAGRPATSKRLKTGAAVTLPLPLGCVSAGDENNGVAFVGSARVLDRRRETRRLRIRPCVGGAAATKQGVLYRLPFFAARCCARCGCAWWCIACFTHPPRKGRRLPRRGSVRSSEPRPDRQPFAPGDGAIDGAGCQCVGPFHSTASSPWAFSALRLSQESRESRGICQRVPSLTAPLILPRLQ